MLHNFTAVIELRWGRYKGKSPYLQSLCTMLFLDSTMPAVARPQRCFLLRMKHLLLTCSPLSRHLSVRSMGGLCQNSRLKACFWQVPNKQGDRNGLWNRSPRSAWFVQRVAVCVSQRNNVRRFGDRAVVFNEWSLRRFHVNDGVL